MTPQDSPIDDLCGPEALRALTLKHPYVRAAVRYERPEPGDMVHLHVKKLGRIPDGGGWRVHGRPGYRKGGGGWEHRPQTNGKADPFLREPNLFRPHGGIGGQPPISRAN